jgi:hypothetical protein
MAVATRRLTAKGKEEEDEEVRCTSPLDEWQSLCRKGWYHG